MSDKIVNVALFADLSTNKLIAPDGGSFVFPTLTDIDTIQFTLRFLQPDDGGNLREVDLPVRNITSSYGGTIQPPTGGTFKLSAPVSGTPTDSAAITYNADAAALKVALDPILPSPIDLASVVLADVCCWVFKLTSGGNFTLGRAGFGTNRLAPISFPRVRVWERFEGEFWCEVRLIQMPLAWNEDGQARVLPPAPGFSRVRAGAPESDEGPAVNELQKLTIPAAWRGTYYINSAFGKTTILGAPADGIDEIGAALNGLFTSGGNRFSVTLPADNNAYVEFIGTLAGSPQDLLDVVVDSFAPGVVTFLMPLTRATVQEALRAAASVTADFEISVELVNADDADAEGRKFTLARQPMTVTRSEQYDELATVRTIDWLRPPERVDYIPYTLDQIITGQQSYRASFGDGSAVEFHFPHNLGTDDISGLVVRENVSNGRALTLNAEYRANFTDDNELVLYFDDPPTANQYRLILTTAGPASAFQAHTHTEAQVVGLVDDLAAIRARLTTLEAIAAGVGFTLPPTVAVEPLSIPIPEVAYLYPGKYAPGALPPNPRLASLLPAMHNSASAIALTDPLPEPEDTAGTLFYNDTDEPIYLPSGGGLRAVYVAPGGFAGSDGRFLYRLTRAGATNSYFPTDFERDLFNLAINPQMWKRGQTLEVLFTLAGQLLLADTDAQLVVVVEVGKVVSQTTPDPTEQNLASIDWPATPLLTQVINLSPISVPHKLGFSIKRNLDDTLTGAPFFYTAFGSAPEDCLPDSCDVIVRGRLARFDTENSVANAQGFVSVNLSAATAQII